MSDRVSETLAAIIADHCDGGAMAAADAILAAGFGDVAAARREATDWRVAAENLNMIIRNLNVLVGKLNASRNEWRDRYHSVTRGANMIHGDDFDPVDKDIDPLGDLRALCEKLASALRDDEEYFDGRADADLPQGAASYIPNEEMRRLADIREALAAAREAGIGGDRE